MTFFTPYYDSNQKLITSKCSIACNYFKFQFWVDSISIIPFQLISDVNPNSTKTRISFLFEFNKFYRVLRFSRIMKATKIGKQGTSAINKFLRKMNKSPSLVLSIAPFYVGGVFIAYFFACIWFYFPDRFNFSRSWLERYNYKVEPVFDKFVGSLYFIYATISTTGYGDIVPSTATEFFLTFIFMSTGVTFYSLVYSTIIGKMEQRRNEGEEIANMKGLLRSLKDDDKCFEQKDMELYAEML